MDSIDKHIQYNIDVLNNPITSSQQRRHIEQELVELQAYKERHPEDSHNPTALELFCDSNPSAWECRRYDV
jgi:hypothetical protein